MLKTISSASRLKKQISFPSIITALPSSIQFGVTKQVKAVFWKNRQPATAAPI